MPIIFKDEHLNGKHVWIDVILDIMVKSKRIYKKEIIPTLVDTGFSGGLRLPEEYSPFNNCDIRVQNLKDNGEIEYLEHEGVRDYTPIKKYSLKFKILDQSKNEIEAASTHVFFKGRRYALLGMDFIIDMKSKFEVDGGNENFSFFL